MEQGFQLNNAVLVFHLIGFGMIATLLFAGPILERRFQKEETLETKTTILRVMKSVGLLSPLAVLLLVATGIGNMYFNHLGPFSKGWLTAKFIFVAMVAVNGAMTGARARKRGKLLKRLARGENVPNALPQMQRYNKQQTTFYLTEWFLVLVILVLSIFQPQ
jgi:uncharacterized membrane protein SirB2